MNRKHKHDGRFHTATTRSERDRKSTGRRAHGLLTKLRSLTPKQTAALQKRLEAGVYANSTP